MSTEVSKDSLGRDPFSLRQPVLSEWPRRLLFLPEMRSYEREPGNLYRDVIEPRYNILSYTWGRWQLLPGEGQAIDVDGISWNIPAVDPLVFTAQEFELILKRIGDGVDWVWVDVACIDQENPLIRDDEIGRQAGIFGNADEAFIWLHHSPTLRLQHFVDVLFEIANRVEGDQEDFVDFGEGAVSVRWSENLNDMPSCMSEDTWAEDVMESLDILDRDPWFSSLWTLQEAFLRGDARILSREGVELKRVGFESVGLASLLAAWGQIHEAIRRTLRNCTDEIPFKRVECLGRILERIDMLGLSAGDNPATLYTTAGYRKTSREDDRIYGIMQVFGFKLGKSATPGVDYSLPELEIQFANALNAKSPVWAQLFNHRRRQAPGRHWCISQSSYVPASLAFCDIAPQSQCTISLGAEGPPVLTGRGCPFKQVGQLWQQCHLQPLQPNFWGTETEDGRIPVELIALDTCEFTDEHIPAELRHVENELSDTNHKLRDFLMQNHGDTLNLFLLGKLQQSHTEDIEDEVQTDELEQSEDDAWIGLIVRPIRRNCNVSWQRVGLAIWPCTPIPDSSPVSWQRITAVLD